MKLVTLQDIDEGAVRGISSDIEIVRVRREDLEGAVQDADILIGSPGNRWREVLRAGENLRWVHVGSAGVDGLMGREFEESKILLTCAKGDVVGPVLAEHAFGLLLGLTRGIGKSVRAGTWASGAEEGVFELGGKTMGLVGFGGVGRYLARLAKGFDMDVCAVRRSPGDKIIDGVTVWGAESFEKLLAIADVVVVSVPDTPATRGMFGVEAFRRMKNSAIVVAVGRGRTIDTEALVVALRDGEISGAGLDVVDPEPLPDDHPLWTMGNVIITPHHAGTSPERDARNRALVLRNLKRFVAGEPLESIVSREAGY